MKIKNIEHMDDFSVNEHVCWAVVEDIPERFVAKAKVIDANEYSEDCFGICVGCDDDGWYVSEDIPKCNLYYIDNDGDKHWMDYELTEQEAFDAIDFCKKYIMEDC